MSAFEKMPVHPPPLVTHYDTRALACCRFVCLLSSLIDVPPDNIHSRTRLFLVVSRSVAVYRNWGLTMAFYKFPESSSSYELFGVRIDNKRTKYIDDTW